jgi:hypothetical protein
MVILLAAGLCAVFCQQLVHGIAVYCGITIGSIFVTNHYGTNVL